MQADVTDAHRRPGWCIYALFYVVDAVRFGFLGASDVSPWISLGVVGAITIALIAWAQFLFSTGHRLKP